MRQLKLLFISFFFLSLLVGCDTIKKKTDALVEKENQKLSNFIGKSLNDLQIELGKSDESFRNDKGNFIFVYNSKKYGCSSF